MRGIISGAKHYIIAHREGVRPQRTGGSGRTFVGVDADAAEVVTELSFHCYSRFGIQRLPAAAYGFKPGNRLRPHTDGGARLLLCLYRFFLLVFLVCLGLDLPLHQRRYLPDQWFGLDPVVLPLLIPDRGTFLGFSGRRSLDRWSRHARDQVGDPVGLLLVPVAGRIDGQFRLENRQIGRKRTADDRDLA